jgi:KUP system potassium uptake protein
VVIGIFGASLFFGGSMITPAISVLSAVEGLEVVAPSLEHLVVPIAVVILVGLFAIQSRGTATVGRLFGPVVLAWFTASPRSGSMASPITRASCGRSRRATARASSPTTA